MKRILLALLASTLPMVGPASAETNVYYDFHVGISNAPPPPRIVYQEAPDVVLVPDTKVYVVERGDNDCDFFRYGKHWYVMSGGYWYRGGQYDGPFKVIDVRNVPRAVLVVPAKHWKHHPKGGPPGLVAKDGGGAGKGKKGKGH